jgi:hypothetical protein
MAWPSAKQGAASPDPFGRRCASRLKIGRIESTVEDATAQIPDNARSFLTANPPRYATIATINADGSPHQIVIWFLLRGDKLIINSRHGRRWPSNLRRDGRANLCVFEAEDAVTVDCEVEAVYEGEEAQADIAEMAWLFDAPEIAQREIARFRTERRVSFALRPLKVHIHGEPV